MSWKKKKSSHENIFSSCDGILLYGVWVVIPASLNKKILKDFHTRHPGVSTMKSLMRSYVYWPGVDKQIKDVVKRCRCCTMAVKVPSVKIKPWPKMDRPWSRLHIDYVVPMNRIYHLIVADSFTELLEVVKCKRPTWKSTVYFLHEIFARFGVPDTIMELNLRLKNFKISAKNF